MSVERSAKNPERGERGNDRATESEGSRCCPSAGPKKEGSRQEDLKPDVDADILRVPTGAGTAPATLGTPSIPILGDIDIPGETALKRDHRLAREATARDRAALEAEEPPPRMNPLFQLPEKPRDELFKHLREFDNYDDVVKRKLAEDGIPDVTDAELQEFFNSEANLQWQRRIGRAATEANSLVNHIEENDLEFSRPILEALGQEAFRQISSGHADPEALKRVTELFLKARADQRSDRLMALRREKLEFERRTHIETALEAFAVEIEKHPEAREAFEALRTELLRGAEVEE